jgi:anti-sigma-K factor RskA
MATGHEHWLEQGDIYALGALDGQELKDFEAHLASGCAVCEAYIRETRESLLLLHRAITPFEPSSAAKSLIFDQIAGDKKIAPITAVQSKRTGTWQRMVGAIAAGIVGVVITAAYYHYRYEPRHSVYSAVIDLLRDPNTRDVALYGAGPTPAALGRFLWNNSGEGHLFVTNLPAAPEGKIYAVWTIVQESSPRYVASIRTDAKGQGGVHINAAPGDKPIQTFAVTLEPVGTTAAPTGPMVLVSKQT